jgi:acyl carrier protein
MLMAVLSIRNTNKTMTNEEKLEKLKAIVKPFVKNENAFENLTETTDFIADLQINSANLVDIVLDVEEAFGIDIDNYSMMNMITIKSTLDIINKKLAEK